VRASCCPNKPIVAIERPKRGCTIITLVICGSPICYLTGIHARTGDVHGVASLSHRGNVPRNKLGLPPPVHQAEVAPGSAYANPTKMTA
jgi:hypothetical protein